LIGSGGSETQNNNEQEREGFLGIKGSDCDKMHKKVPFQNG